MKNKYPVCPICGNEEKFQIEKSPYGDTKCLECSYKASHKHFSVQEDDGNEVIIICVMRFKPSGKYYDTTEFEFAMDEEIFKLCWYSIIEEVRKFRNRSGTDLEYLIGYSDNSVKNYTNNDVYPILLKD